METASETSSSYNGRPFEFSRAKKIRFVATYVWTKVFSFWYEVKEPRIRLFTYEVIYSLCRAVRYPPPALAWLRLSRVRTIFGVFNIRPGTTEAAYVSPGFERLDVDHLLNLLGQRLSAGRSVLFLDVGADVGTYAVSVGNRLRNLGKISVLAFEPSLPSFELLSRNIADNDLTEIVQLRALGLGDGSVTSAALYFNPLEPGGRSLHASGEWQRTESENVELSTVDDQVDLAALADVVVFKLDVEGSEIAVLDGAAATLAAASEALLLVEDFIDGKIITYLEETGWSFQGKFTPYNSFWRYAGAAAH